MSISTELGVKSGVTFGSSVLKPFVLPKSSATPTSSRSPVSTPAPVCTLTICIPLSFKLVPYVTPSFNTYGF